MNNILQNPLNQVMETIITTLRNIAHNKGVEYYCTADYETGGLYHDTTKLVKGNPVYYNNRIGNDYIVEITTHYEFHPVRTTGDRQISYGIKIVVSKNVNNVSTTLGEIIIESDNHGQTTIEINRRADNYTDTLNTILYWQNLHIPTKDIAMIASSAINAFIENIPTDHFIFQDIMNTNKATL